MATIDGSAAGGKPPSPLSDAALGSSAEAEEEGFRRYLSDFRVGPVMEILLNLLHRERPRDPYAFMAKHLRQIGSEAVISKLRAREIFDSRGQPTIQVEIFGIVENEEKMIASHAAPSLIHETKEARDKDDKHYGGKGLIKVVKVINTAVSTLLAGTQVFDVKAIDQKLRQFESRQDAAGRLGNNALCALSKAVVVAGAALKDISVSSYLQQLSKSELESEKTQAASQAANLKSIAVRLPCPSMAVITAGKIYNPKIRVTDFSVVPLRDVNTNFNETVRELFAIHSNLGKFLATKYGAAAARSISEIGAYTATPIENLDAVITVIEEAIKMTGLTPGVEVGIAVNVNATECYDADSGKYDLGFGPKTTADVLEWYCSFKDAHPSVVLYEDPFTDKDTDSWALLTSRLGSTVTILGSDLFGSDSETLRRGLNEKWANGLSLRVDRTGLVTETIETIQTAKAHAASSGSRFAIVIGQRPGETNSGFPVDMADFIRVGGPVRGEHVAKWNRMIEILERR